MSVLIPPAVNYPSPLNAIPVVWDREPIEGPQLIPVEIDWANMGGTSKSVAFNVAAQATLKFTQIVALDVDNSGCGSDITFIFPDGPTTLVVPAYESGVFPVFTHSQSFYVVDKSGLSVDVTRFNVLNKMPPVLSIPKTSFQSALAAPSVNASVTGTTPIIPNGVSGTLEYLNVCAALIGVATISQISFLILDGSGATLGGGFVYCPAGVTNVVNAVPFTLSNGSLRFQNGLAIAVTATPAPGAQSSLFVSALFRTP